MLKEGSYLNNIPDPFAKKIKLPVFVKNGKLVLFDGRELPKIKEGSIGDLVLDEYCVLDQDIIQELQHEDTVELLGTQQTVYIGLSPNMVPKALLRRLVSPGDIKIHSDHWFARVLLLEPLMLRMRGSKKSVLEDCKCSIPSLKHQEARSLNHAFALLSAHFEKLRRTHSGNAFTRIFYNDQGIWLPLNEKRLVAEINRDLNKSKQRKKDAT